MTTPTIAERSTAGACQGRDATTWLGLAASPTFALMAWVSGGEASQALMCASVPAMSPIGGMASMYLLMSLFHLSPWLKLASSRRQHIQPATRTEGE